MNKPASGQRNQVRIIGGTHRTRRIQFPDVPGLRPTSDRIRETLFNWLRDDIVGARCLDLFAGSGALGFEALSRGAQWVEFVDESRKVRTALAQGLEILGFDNARVQCMQAQKWIESHAETAERYDIVFLDPPFAQQLLPSIGTQLDKSGHLHSDCKIYIESANELSSDDVPSAWRQLKYKRAGAVSFYLFCTSSQG